MFRRRNKVQAFNRLRSMLWPQIGWRRTGKYVFHRLMRLPGTAHSVAAGFACGVALSFTPFVGFHFALAALLAWIIGANVIASAIGTIIGNPWTFPIIWLAIYRLGILILGWEIAETLPAGITFTYIVDHPFAVLLPMTVGGIPLSALAWILSYWPVRRLVTKYQQLRRRSRARRRKRRGDAVYVESSSQATGRRVGGN